MSHSASMGRHGVAVFFEHPPHGLVWGSAIGVMISRPGGEDLEAIAVVEAARVAAPAGEVVAFRFPVLAKADIPDGSYVSFDEPDWS